MTKSKHVTFRCTQEQYEQIKGQAKANGTTISEFIVERACADNDSPIYLSSDALAALQEDMNRLRTYQLKNHKYYQPKDKS